MKKPNNIEDKDIEMKYNYLVEKLKLKGIIVNGYTVTEPEIISDGEHNEDNIIEIKQENDEEFNR